MTKWYVVLATKYDASVYVKGYDTKAEALKDLSDKLEEEDDNITFFTIRKDAEREESR